LAHGKCGCGRSWKALDVSDNSWEKRFEMDKKSEAWVMCPICGSKTRLRLRHDTVLKNFPLFCPKCKQERVVNAKEFRVVPAEAEKAV